MVKTPATKSATFESAVAELETIVQDMENGQLPLDQALSAYQRGTGLLRHCQGLLTKAEQTIRVLEAEAPGRHPAMTAFSQWMADIQQRTESALDRALPAADIAPARLHEAMRYAVLGGGKRVRPLLVHRRPAERRRAGASTASPAPSR
jgi:exodeoxyribonuclease VII small subunit